MNSNDFTCIGVVHLLSLPVSPGYDAAGGMRAITARARHDALAYLDAGFDGVLFENFMDVPFFPGPVPASTVASMAAVIISVLDHLDAGTRLEHVFFGVNVLRNDPIAALAIAHATGAGFIRVNVHSGAVVADQGIIESRAHETLRSRRSLDATGVQIWADVQVKHAAPLVQRSILQESDELVNRALADALIFTGPSTGSPVEIDTLHELPGVQRRHPTVPLFLGSGASVDNIDELRDACAHVVQGCIVGSAVKQDGVAANPVDPARARAFIARARAR